MNNKTKITQKLLIEKKIKQKIITVKKQIKKH